MRRSSAKRRASSSPTVGDDDTAERAIVWAHETAIDDAAVPASSSGTGGVAAPATPTPTKSVETTPDIALLTTMLVDGAGARNGHLDHAQLEQARLGIRLDRMLFPGVWLSYTRYLPLSRTRSWSDFTGIWSINSTCPVLVAVLGMANAMPHPRLRRARPTAAHAPTLTLARAWRAPSLTLTHQPAKLRRRSRQCSRASSWRPSARTWWLRLEVDHARRGERVRPAVGTTSAPGLDDDLMREVHAIHALVDARTAPACASGAMVGERVHAASARMPRTDGADARGGAALIGTGVVTDIDKADSGAELEKMVTEIEKNARALETAHATARRSVAARAASENARSPTRRACARAHNSA